MARGNIQISATTGCEFDEWLAYVQQVMGRTVDLDASRLYHVGRSIARQITMEVATLELPPRTSREAT